MPAAPLRVLLVEENASDARLLRGLLEGGRTRRFEITEVPSLGAALDRLASGRFDVVLLDLEHAGGLDAARRLQAAADVAVVVLTTRSGEALARKAVRLGVQDYLLKGTLDVPTVVRVIANAVERRQAAVALETRALQQAVVAELGRRALAGGEIGALMDEVVRLVASTLQVEYAKVLELLPDGHALLLRAGVGWEEGLVGRATVPAGADSQAGYTLLQDEPVVVEDLRAETRFKGPALLRDHGVVSGASVVVPLRGGPFGVLAAHTTRLRTFTADDVNFLQAVANVLAAAIDRQRAEQATERRRKAAEALAEVGRLLSQSLEIELVGQRIVDSVCRLTDTQAATLFRLDQQSGNLVVVAVAGDVGPIFARGELFSPGTGAAGLAVITQQPVTTLDVLADPRITLTPELRGRIEQAKYRSVLAVPLLVQDRVIGALGVGDRGGRVFGPEEIELAQAFADRAALALESARLYEEVRDARDFLQSIAENSADGIMTTDVHGRVTYASPRALEMLGYSAAEGFGRYAAEFYGGGIEEATTVMRRLVAEERIRNYETSLRAMDGRLVEVSVSLSLLWDARGAVVGTLGIFKDMTEWKQLEESLRQSQKLEALGRLAGGIAHDFNNLMTIISGRSQILLGGLRPADPLRRDIELFKKTSERASVLTRQLLAFSRKQVLQPKVLDLNAVVTGMESILRRLIGEDIELATALMPGLGRVRTDPGQLEQVVVNLAVNARDAMPDGGKLTLETANVDLGPEYASRHAGVKPGPYVLLAVSDTGEGMDAATRARIFEPFFTTKEPGKGTGLGLATVYGIVKQSGGNVGVYSEPGRGTTFKIYLPRVEEAEVAPEPPPVAPGRGSETVLLVEDEDDVRSVGREILEMHGYTVLEARHPGEALLIAERHAGPIHILVTDVVMPKMNGRELAERLAALRPETAVLYVSGYTDDAIVHHGVLDPGTAFLEKPFNPDDLARKVREVLDRA